jgi:hypothetical protein
VLRDGQLLNYQLKSFYFRNLSMVLRKNRNKHRPFKNNKLSNTELSLTKPAAVIIEILKVSIFIISTISIPQVAMPLCFHVFPDSL